MSMAIFRQPSFMLKESISKITQVNLIKWQYDIFLLPFQQILTKSPVIHSIMNNYQFCYMFKSNLMQKLLFDSHYLTYCFLGVLFTLAVIFLVIFRISVISFLFSTVAPFYDKPSSPRSLHSYRISVTHKSDIFPPFRVLHNQLSGK